MTFRYAPIDNWLILMLEWQPLLDHWGSWGPIQAGAHHGRWSCYMRKRNV